MQWLWEETHSDTQKITKWIKQLHQFENTCMAFGKRASERKHNQPCKNGQQPNAKARMKNLMILHLGMFLCRGHNFLGCENNFIMSYVAKREIQREHIVVLSTCLTQIKWHSTAFILQGIQHEFSETMCYFGLNFKSTLVDKNEGSIIFDGS